MISTALQPSLGSGHPSQQNVLSLSVSSTAPGSSQQSVLAHLAESGKTVRLVRNPLSGSYIRPEWSNYPTRQIEPGSGRCAELFGSNTAIIEAASKQRGSSRSTGRFENQPPSTDSRTSPPISAARATKERNLALILPVNDVLHMTPSHWTEIYVLERRYLPTDWFAERESAVLGVRQSNVTRDHRHSIVKWMSEACVLFRWTSQTFFTAVHAWDAYMTTVNQELVTGDLAKLSAACLYFGAQLVESAADENVKTLDDFCEMCPEVGNASALREIQAHLVDTLQGISLVRRTPTDFILLFLAQLQVAPSPGPQLYQCLIQQHMLDLIWDMGLTVALTIYTNGLVLDGLQGSRWIAGTMLRVLELACPALRTDVTAREILMQHVFHMPTSALEAYQTTVMDPIIKSVWNSIFLANNSNTLGGSEQDTPADSLAANNNRASVTTVGSLECKKMMQPYEVIRHSQPPGFPTLPMLFPSNKITQDVTAHLRNICFDSATPPYFPSLLPSASAVKRGTRTRLGNDGAELGKVSVGGSRHSVGGGAAAPCDYCGTGTCCYEGGLNPSVPPVAHHHPHLSKTLQTAPHHPHPTPGYPT